MSTIQKNNVLLRDLLLSDVPNLVALDAKLQGSAWTSQNFCDEIESATSGTFGLFAQNDLPPAQSMLGYLIYRSVLDEWELLNIVTMPFARRHGLGMHMLNELIERAQSAKAQRIMLEVRSRNLAAISLYQRLNFIQDGLRKKYYRDDGDDALLMSLLL